MKLQAFSTALVIALLIAQTTDNASAETAKTTAQTRIVSASAAASVTEPAAVPAPQMPRARASVDPSLSPDARNRQRPVRRAAPRQQQQQQQQQEARPTTWQERMRSIWGVDNQPAEPSQNAATRSSQPQYPQAPAYSTRPNSRLMFGMFYTKIPRQVVDFPGNHAPGTIIVRHNERRLYYVLGNGQAIRYAVAVGREGAAWSGVSTVSNKREWPSWTPTPEILRRQPNLPRFMEGGPNNPMGARALYLGDTLYRIHGTNEPWMIVEEVSSGCIRMTNEDVIDLYERTRLGARVIVQR
jgi:lipoprotein-anchoring transpeptidase ErfK/SrfK